MRTVAIHPPKTPVTKASNTIAAATLPNVCKMPGPPAPFVPTPLPNIARSALSPAGFSRTVKIEGAIVGIRGCSFKSMGDIASKGTGGGIISMNVEGEAKFIAPGSLTVKVEGKNVQLLGDVMSNNNGPSGSPPNAATMTGALHEPNVVPPDALDYKCNVDSTAKKGWDDCQMKQFCAKLATVSKKKSRPAQVRNARQGENRFRKEFIAAPLSFEPIHSKFYDPCAKEKAEEGGYKMGKAFQPDHEHDIQRGGSATSFKNFKWIDSSVNSSVGQAVKAYEKSGKTGGIAADCCPA
jgi:uncharacterized Zn-binding protein involved in type VI secretion